MENISYQDCVGSKDLPIETNPEYLSRALAYKNNVFKGEDGLSDFLNPEIFQQTPLVELPNSLNPYLDRGVHVFAKMLSLTPLMNIKSVPSFHMIDQAYKEGNLDNVEELIESSSGNTALGLSVFARHYGIQNTRVIVDDTISPCLLKNLLLFGLKVQIHPTDSNSISKLDSSRVDLARKEGRKQGKFNPDQYDNKHNPAAHFKYTAKELLNQLDGNIQVFSTGLGTAGTMVGISKALRLALPKIKCVGTVRAPNTYVPGPRTLELLKEVSYKWEDSIDSLQDATPNESYTMSLKLLRSGIMGGPSSGLNLAGSFKYLDDCIANRTLDSLRNSEDKINLVFLVCDSPFLHVDKYFKHVSKDFFLPVENGNLLKESCSAIPTVTLDPSIVSMPAVTRGILNVDCGNFTSEMSQ
ncbi:MAG TPA: pyridoxal-phosphate dependent enzyme [Oligoflexia bacterium]|nr:pyridoxal-phosphate dependent enzyme [Oligoflexia bacterium]HMP49589.1 pyridoxal-phosphate dependent enzyme [Oligoflexia bacterium]